VSERPCSANFPLGTVMLGPREVEHLPQTSEAALKRISGPTIVYTHTRDQTETLARLINSFSQ